MEWVKNHQILYEKSRISTEIENNRLHDRSRADDEPLIFIRMR